MDNNFVDHITIHVRSGRGGAGSASLRREKFVPKGGPDGGDGGRGGHVIARGNAQLWTLHPLRYTRHIRAGHGQPGGKQRATGADGQDRIVAVPLGTVVRAADTAAVLCEITRHGQEEILLRGGRGGLGNWHFRSSTAQTPRYAQPGEDGREARFTFELKVLADVGLVGLPNAGKSTLLAALTAAKPRIADFPFTTLKPQLGIVKHRDAQSFIMADIPGLIEGASAGRGLGDRFLRHIERNTVLLFLIAADTPDPQATYRVLLHELQQHNPQLLDKRRLVVISKADLLDAAAERRLAACFPTGSPHAFISAVSGRGLTELKDFLWQRMNSPL